MTQPLYVELSADGLSVRLNGTGGPSTDGLCVSADGIEGWYSTPDAKVSMTEMQTGDGAHAIQEQDVLYSARTVTVEWFSSGGSRAGALAGVERLLSLAHRLVTLRVVDADSDTWATGYVQVGVDAGVANGIETGTLTVVCADPRRYSTEAHRLQMLPSTYGTSGGLSYGEGGGLVYDLTYGEFEGTLQNVATLTNAGTSTAYPTITVNGTIYAGLTVSHDSGSVTYSQQVGGVPLVLDSLTRTASVGGLDTSRYLTSRGFPTVPAGGSVTLRFMATGSGWVTVEWHDTYV